MLIASYLVGYNMDKSVGHLAVNRVFPDDVVGAYYEIREIEPGLGTHFDLLLYFPHAPMPNNLVCLPELPAAVTEILLSGSALPVLDFATGHVVERFISLQDRNCA